MITLFKSKYKVQVNYKSGIQKEFWVYEWNQSVAPRAEASWRTVSFSNRPMHLAVDSIESTWIVANRVNLFTYFINMLKGIKDRLNPAAN